MKCDEVEEMLSAYADGEIGGHKAAEVRTHLAGCESCSDRLEALEVLQSKLGEMMSERLKGPDVLDAVMASLPVRGRPVLPRLAWVFAGIAMAAIVCWQSVPRMDRPHTKKAQVAVNVPVKHYEEHKGVSPVSGAKPAMPVSDEKHRAPKPWRPYETVSTAGSGKHKPGVRRPGFAHAPEQERAPQAEPTGPIQVVTNSKTVDGTTETTIEITAGALMLLRTKTTEVEIARDDNAATIERPPLEVVRNSPSAEAGVTGG